MIKARKLAVLAAALFLVGAGIAEARPGGSGGRGGHSGYSGARPGGAYVHGGHGYRPAYGGGYRPYYRPYYRPFVGASFFGYPGYYYPSPAYYAPTPAPVYYIEQPQQQPQPLLQQEPQPQYQQQPQQFYQQLEPQSQAQPENREYSYYCASPQGYFPDVSACPGGWERIDR